MKDGKLPALEEPPDHGYWHQPTWVVRDHARQDRQRADDHQFTLLTERTNSAGTELTYPIPRWLRKTARIPGHTFVNNRGTTYEIVQTPQGLRARLIARTAPNL